MNKSSQEDRVIVFCTRCGETASDINKVLVGNRVRCKCGETAYVAWAEADKWWISILNAIVTYTKTGLKNFKKFLLYEFIADKLKLWCRWPLKDEPLIKVLLLFLYAVIFIILGLFRYNSIWLNYWLSMIVVGFLSFFLIDTLIFMISDAFITRLQRNLVRSLIILLIKYLQAILTFGYFYYLFSAGSMWRCVYISFATITTLGEGDFSPSGMLAMFVAIEVMIGMLFIIGVLGAYIGDFSRVKQYEFTLAGLIKKSKMYDDETV